MGMQHWEYDLIESQLAEKRAKRSFRASLTNTELRHERVFGGNARLAEVWDWARQESHEANLTIEMTALKEEGRGGNG